MASCRLYKRVGGASSVVFWQLVFTFFRSSLAAEENIFVVANIVRRGAANSCKIRGGENNYILGAAFWPSLGLGLTVARMMHCTPSNSCKIKGGKINYIRGSAFWPSCN